MSSIDITNVKKLIRDIKNKLNELERAIDKSPVKKFGSFTNHPPQAPRKKSVYRASENNSTDVK